MRVITEPEFETSIRKRLDDLFVDGFDVGSVTGPGRSGAIAAVYASHILGIPFIPFGQMPTAQLGRILIIDTAIQSGRTLGKAARRYGDLDPRTLAIYQKPPRVIFWYEATNTDGANRLSEAA